MSGGNGTKIRLPWTPGMRELLREVNEQIAQLAAGSEVLTLVCECRNRGCADALEVPAEVFRGLREIDGCFVVRPGHDDSRSEAALRREHSFTIVRQTAPPALAPRRVPAVPAAPTERSV